MDAFWWYQTLPWLVACVWIVHAVISWYRPRRVNPAGWLLLAGMPLVALLMMVAETNLYPVGQPRDEGLFGPGFGMVVVSMELAALWVVVLILECLLSGIRHSRRTEVARVSVKRVAV